MAPRIGDRFVLIQDSLKWKNGTPAAFSVRELLADKTFEDVIVESDKALKAIKTLLQQKAGATKLTFQEVPVLFLGKALSTDAFMRSRSAVAFTPNLANFQSIAGKLYFPRVFGPRTGAGKGKDLFEQVVKDLFKLDVPENPAMPEITTKARFVDDWQEYHRWFGDLHCGSVVKREGVSLWWII